MATNLFRPNPWGELLIQGSVKDLKSRQDSRDFTGSGKDHSIVRQNPY